jgi:L-aminopeptidase/D-esterase-like protein
VKKKMSAWVFACADRGEVRRTDRGEGRTEKEDRKGHETIVVVLATFSQLRQAEMVSGKQQYESD